MSVVASSQCQEAPARWYGKTVGAAPTFRRVLLVDDNGFYADRLAADLALRGAQVEWVDNAAAGVDILQRRGAEFDALVSDISMETELAGLKVLRMARRCGFRGQVASATTGLDTWWGFAINRFVLGTLYRCDYLIPKRPIHRSDRVMWIPVDARTRGLKRLADSNVL